jgi:hypothetical protein
VPLVCGEPFEGSVTLQPPGPLKLQEVRAELRVRVEATVSQGESETITAWSGQLASTGTFDGAATIACKGVVPSQALPSIELPHGRATTTFHVILARAWAPDTHLVRDVAVATTREV